MSTYIVEVHGDVRELYTVEADSEAEAMENWHTGDIFLTETSSAGPVSARMDD